jgi:GntR family transcriptional regulator
VKKLEALELVEIIHGRGIFIHIPKIHLHAIRFSSFSEIIRQLGKVPGSKTLKADVRSADPLVAAQLALKVDSSIYYLKRLRFADNDPIAIEISYLPTDRFPGLLELYNDPMSLYHLLQVEYNVRFSAGLQTLEAKAATEQESHLLDVALCTPILFLSTIAYDVNSVPVEYGESFYRGDRYKYISHLQR